MHLNKLFPVALVLVFAVEACEDSNTRRQAELASIQRLSDLEKRSFALVNFNSNTGQPVIVGSVRDLEAVEREARDAVMSGCAVEARSALVSTLDEILHGGTNAWHQAERYRHAADECAAALKKQPAG